MVWTLAALKAANKALGQHWFDAGAMRFFRTRVFPSFYGRFFVTRETGPDGIARYSVREAASDGAVTTYGVFGGYASLAEAQKAAKAFAAFATRKGREGEGP